MRIVIVNSGLRYGGVETQIIEFGRELVRRGHAVALYTLTDDVPRLHELDGSGITVVVDNKRRKLDAGVLWRLRCFIRSFRADVVHGFLFDGNFYSRVAAFGMGVPALNSESSDNYVLTRLQSWSHGLTRGLAAGVVANSSRGRDFAQRLFGFPDERMHVVLNGIRLQDVERRVAACTEDYRRTFFATEGVRMACLVGSIYHAKDYLLALDVADRLTRLEDGWKVLFIGDSFKGTTGYASAEAAESQQYRAQVQARFEALNLEGRACFAGQRGDVLEIMAQCDALFSTSRYEGSPNVVLEAMAVGTPVVTVEYSDIRSMLPVAWQVVERDPDALARTIVRAAEARDSLAREQLQWVREHAALERVVASLEAVYRQYGEQVR